jgi:hypothetical protein
MKQPYHPFIRLADRFPTQYLRTVRNAPISRFYLTRELFDER